MSKPDELHRHALKTRAIKTLSKKVTSSPSEKKSERLRAKLNRGQPDTRTLPEDCRGCEKMIGSQSCGKTLNTCGEKMVVDRCNKCGLKVRYRFIFGEFNYRCPVCRSV
jgi:hypothetical protein